MRQDDLFDAGEVLADQPGADGVLTFTFDKHVAEVWVLSRGGLSRADPFGGTPTASLGIPCVDGVPTPVRIHTRTVKVYAPVGAVVTVWGCRNAD